MKKSVRHILLLAALGYVFFMLGNGLLPLTDPDEVFYAETAKEMAARHEWNIPYIFGQPQFEKPVLIYWLLRAAFLAFGMTPFAARFFPALFAMVGVIGVYLLASLGFKDKRKGFFAALCLMSSGLYIGLGRTVFTDMVFTVLILLAMLAFFWAYAREKRRDLGIVLFFFFCGLATLAKGPLGLVLPAASATLFLSLRKELRSFLRPSLAAGFAVFGVVCLPWYWYITARFGNSFIHEFFYNDHIRRVFFAEHAKNDRWYFYPASMVGLFFPWCFFLAAGFRRLWVSRGRLVPLQQLALCWLGVVFVVFQAAHSKLVSYIFPLFPALALVCGDFLGQWLRDDGKRGVRGGKVFLVTWGVLLLVPVAAIIAVPRLKFISLTLAGEERFIAAFMGWLLLLLLLFLRGRRSLALYLVALAIPIVFLAMPVDRNQIEPYFSTEKVSLFVRNHYSESGPLMVSKSFARGILYHSGRQVAIFGIGEKNYFSPHPVDFLDTEEKMSEFLRRNGTTYCVLRKKQVDELRKVCVRLGFVCEGPTVFGSSYLMRVGVTGGTPR